MPDTEQLGLQLYTLREHTANDLLGTLGRVAAMGYRTVEFAGYAGLAPAQIRAALDEYGLRALAAHIPLSDFERRPDSLLADAQTLGCDYVVIPFVPEVERSDAARVKRLAESLNRYGVRCQSTGLRLAYHNHDFEFAPLAGGNMFDWLVRDTDPALVAFELDVYWAQYAGTDALAAIEGLTGRVPLLHVKDMAADASRADVPVGAGCMPWPAIFAAAAKAGTEWYIVEQDYPNDALLDVERSLQYLRQMQGSSSYPS